MAVCRIDKLGFLRRDGKIVSWCWFDFVWAARGWFK